MGYPQKWLTSPLSVLRDGDGYPIHAVVGPVSETEFLTTTGHTSNDDPQYLKRYRIDPRTGVATQVTVFEEEGYLFYESPAAYAYRGPGELVWATGQGQVFMWPQPGRWESCISPAVGEGFRSTYKLQWCGDEDRVAMLSQDWNAPYTMITGVPVPEYRPYDTYEEITYITWLAEWETPVSWVPGDRILTYDSGVYGFSNGVLALHDKQGTLLDRQPIPWPAGKDGATIDSLGLPNAVQHLSGTLMVMGAMAEQWDDPDLAYTNQGGPMYTALGIVFDTAGDQITFTAVHQMAKASKYELGVGVGLAYIPHVSVVGGQAAITFQTIEYT